MKRISKIFLVIFCFLVLVLPFFNSSAIRKNSIENNNKNIASPALLKFVAMLDEERKQHFLNFEAKHMDFFPSVEKACKAIPLEFRLPEDNLAGEFKGIYVQKWTVPDEIIMWLYYNDIPNGICLQVQPRPNKPDYESKIKEELQDIDSGFSKADKKPQAVEVNGLDGYGWEPGYNNIDGKKYPRPGFVSWWDDGVSYTLFGTRGENGTSINELIQIANSMYSESIDNTVTNSVYSEKDKKIN